MRNILIFIGSLFILTGCSWFQPEVIETTKYVRVVPSASMTQQIRIPRPPDRELYLTKDSDGRELALTNYNLTLLAALGKADIKLKALNEWRIGENNKTVVKNNSIKDNNETETNNDGSMLDSIFGWMH